MERGHFGRSKKAGFYGWIPTRHLSTRGKLDTDKIEVLSDDIPVSSVALTEDGYMLLGDGVWKMYEDGRKTRLFDEFDGGSIIF